MPFTVSHPAAVLPLLRIGVPASALVIGSLSPDLPYFVPLRVGGFYSPVSLGLPTHTVSSLPTLDLAIGLVAWMLWHGLVAGAAVAAAPEAARARLVGRYAPGVSHRLRSPREVAGTVVGLVVGAATHVGWDAFTHVDRWGTQHLAVLTATWHGIPGYKWAQYVSSVAGLAVLLGFLVGWWRRTTPFPAANRSGTSPSQPWAVWAALLVAGTAVGGLPAATAADLMTAAYYGATRGGAAMLALALLLALTHHLLPRRAGRLRRRPSVGMPDDTVRPGDGQ